MKKTVALVISVMLVICMLGSAFAASSKTIYGSWMVKHYIDDFQEEISDKYASPVNLVSGTFSNSATTNSQAYLDIVVDTYRTFFFFF